MKDTFKALFPVRDIEVAGEQIALWPFTFGQLPKVVGALGSIIDEALVIDFRGIEIDEKGNLQLTPAFLLGASKLLQTNGDKVMTLISLGTGWPVEKIEALPPDEGMKLAAGVFMINQDFFQTRLRPVFDQLVRAAQKKDPGDQKDSGSNGDAPLTT